MGINCLKDIEPLRGGSLLFTSRFPGVPRTQLPNFRRMKGWVDLGATQWFWTRDPSIRNPVAISNLSCRIRSTLNWAPVTPTFLAEFQSISLDTNLSHILAKISMKASLFRLLKSLNIAAFSFSYSWRMFLFSWSRSWVTPVVSECDTKNWIFLGWRNAKKL